jgi:hydrogenase maturation protease
VTGAWGELERRGPESVTVDGVEVRSGSRVVLRPTGGGDVFDLALAGRVAVVDSVEQDAEGRVQLAVTLEDDPGRELGTARVLGHRFFFAAAEVEPLAGAAPAAPAVSRVLVAGIGNVFLGDDGFGVRVAQRLADRGLPAGAEVRDFGIRGLDLAYALQDPYEAVVFVDAAPRGERPGTLTVLEAEPDEDLVAMETHGMDPVQVLALARALGRVPPRVLVVACEPETIVLGEHDDELVGELSAPVEAAVEEGIGLVGSLVEELLAQDPSNRKAVSR